MIKMWELNKTESWLKGKFFELKCKKISDVSMNVLHVVDSDRIGFRLETQKQTRSKPICLNTSTVLSYEAIWTQRVLISFSESYNNIFTSR